MTVTPTTPAPEDESIIARLLNIDTEIEKRAVYPDSSISCEAAREVILNEIRKQLDSYGDRRELEGGINACNEIVKRHVDIAERPGSHAITPLIAANYALELESQKEKN